MKIYNPRNRIIRLNITGEGEEKYRLSLCETTLEEVVCMCNELLRDYPKNLVKTDESVSCIRVHIREHYEGTNRRASSLRAIGLTVSQFRNMILQEIAKREETHNPDTTECVQVQDN